MIRFRFNQSVVYWPRVGADNFGKPRLGGPAVLPCRVESEMIETVNSDGDKVMSSTQVWTESDFVAGGYMMPAFMTPAEAQAAIDATDFPRDDPKRDRRVREIISAGKIPSVRGTQTLRKAMLK